MQKQVWSLSGCLINQCQVQRVNTEREVLLYTMQIILFEIDYIENKYLLYT